MVGEIVINQDAARFPANLQTSLHPAESRERGHDPVERDRGLEGGNGRGQGVSHIVIPGRAHLDPAEAPFVMDDVERGALG